MLPIVDIQDDLARAVRRTRRIILTAPTGSGKSTQVPQMLLDLGALGTGKAVVLQPRRLATRLLALHCDDGDIAANVLHRAGFRVLCQGDLSR